MCKDSASAKLENALLQYYVDAEATYSLPDGSTVTAFPNYANAKYTVWKQTEESSRRAEGSPHFVREFLPERGRD